MNDSITAVLKELQIDYRLTGDEASACCPAHEDRHPSWSCNIKTGVHHCFSCGFGGNLASLVAYVLGYNYPEAVLWVNARVGWARAHQWREDAQIDNFSPAYLKLSDADLALFTAPPPEALIARNISATAADMYGVLWNPANESWVLPIRDPYTNDLWGWQEKNDRRFRNYPHGVKKSETLFGLGAFSYGCPIILVESPIDSMRIYSAGRRSGLAAYGVSISSKQQSLIHQLTEHLVLALDNDSAGMAETARLCREFSQVRRVSVFNYGLTEVKDPGEMTDEEIREGIDNAWPALRWMNVHRDFRSIPARTSREVQKSWESFTRVHNGAG